MNKLLLKTIYLKAHSYSTKVDLRVGSSFFDILQQLIKSKGITSETQIEIERYINKLGRVYLEESLNKSSGSKIIHEKLNPILLDLISKKYEDLIKLLDNYRENNLILADRNDSNGIFIHDILIKLSNDEIISQLLGRVILIISEYIPYSNETASVNLSNDLASSLFFSSLTHDLVKYNRVNKLNFSLNHYIKINNLEEKFSNPVLDIFGLQLFGILTELNLINLELFIDGKKKQNIYTPTKELKDS